MILIKTENEINLMKQAGFILKTLRKMLSLYLKPGISTYYLDILAKNFIKKQRAVSAFKDYQGFSKHICTSVNEVVVHGIPSKKQILKSGDIITIDLGINYKGYFVDSAFTYAIGSVETPIIQLIEVTQKALYEGLKQVKPNNYIVDISRAIEEFIKPYGYGIVKDFTGHGIGKNLHEEPYIPNCIVVDQENVELKPGMIFCIEPMITLGNEEIEILLDNWTAVTVDRSLSAHFEHTVLVTEKGYEILT
ncbi:Methionine aminopeptidase [Candidatus Phytoplasma mali]|uniref:Methionine aminopeptidase n=2 Tax=Apple proliferation phytoplasma TaxID=37692 RepID=B3R012_PHYMT|nr:type I methionyl aminopeptidase [Candidatus Phytoplasma mali]CAP18549.1 Methionine aminopeptidase [Candidatus Phytoplasma mali]